MSEIGVDADIRLRNSLMSILVEYDSTVEKLILASEDEEGNLGTPIEDIVEEEREQLRHHLIAQLVHTIERENQLTDGLPSKTYEVAVYQHLLDRLRRFFGFYKAMEKAQEESRQRNQAVGADAFSLKIRDLEDVLTKMDEIQFIRNLGTSIGVRADDLDKIVEFTIAKEFAPRTPRLSLKKQDNDQ